MKNETNVAPIVPEASTRKKSPETVLKQEMAAINREMKGIDKTLASFKEMQKEVAGAETKKANLTARLDIVKAELIKALGLD